MVVAVAEPGFVEGGCTAVTYNLKKLLKNRPTGSEAWPWPCPDSVAGQQARQTAMPALGSANLGLREAANQKVKRLNRLLQQSRPYFYTTCLSVQH